MVDPDPAAAPPAATETHAPISLDTIKDDLGIPAGDTTQDAWLQRRVDGVWSRMEKYCARRLVAPPASFVDDWGEIAQTGVFHNEPPPLASGPVSSVFLRCFPVAEIVALEMNGTAGDASVVRYDWRSGKLFSLDAAQFATDLSGALRSGRAKITYKAGWEEIPSDLYEALLGSLASLWQQRAQQAAGLGGGSISSINVQDVGQVDFLAGSLFEQAAMKGVGTGGDRDPLLGPWTALLEPYVDYRALIGSPLLATTTELPP